MENSILEVLRLIGSMGKIGRVWLGRRFDDQEMLDKNLGELEKMGFICKDNKDRMAGDVDFSEPVYRITKAGKEHLDFLAKK